MTQTNTPRDLLSAGIALLLAVMVLAHAAPLRAAPGAWRDSATGFAIGGYDPVAYYINKVPTPGREGVEHRWGGAVWKFTNSGNRDAFAKHPEIYAPGFAGYDAHALAKGFTVQGLPVVWAMYRRRVYLFHDGASLQQWRRDREKITAAARANWPGLAKELPGASQR
ncbi:MAG: hypothetical protein IIB62_00290 [Proteobacteria bacterium]|nr:hypothetical protein [Pseudomonadota bacterium]